ncbi:MAG: PAS domain S-box protein [Deltaproteobacteria bacterium]|nr:PAS domain S-box protein [Deltaproteobacteria bacterium]
MMRIRTKILINIFLTIFLILAFGVVLLIANLKMNAIHEDEMTVGQIMKEIAELKIITHEYLLYPEQRVQAQWFARYKSLSKLFELKKINSHEYVVTLNKIRHEHVQINTIFDAIITNQAQWDLLSPNKQSNFKEQENRLVGRLLIKTQSMVTEAFRLNAINNRSLEDLERTFQIVTLVFFIILILTVTSVSFWIYKSVVNPIGILEKGVSLIEDGNFDHRVGTQTKDEIGRLSRAFEQMSQRLISTNKELMSEIKERKKINRNLKESQIRYQTVADFTFDWETWIDPDGNYIYISPSCERISGYTADEYINDPDLMIKISHPDDKQLVVNHFNKGEALSSPMHPIDFRITKRNGEVVWINHVCQRVDSPEGIYLGRRGSNKDVTDMKKQQKELEKYSDTQTILYKEVNHRVKNNLMAITSMLHHEADLIKKRQPKSFAPILKRLTGRIESLSVVHSLLSDNKWSSLNLSHLCQEIVNSAIKPYPKLKKCDINISPSPVEISSGEAHHLSLVLNELATNSTKHIHSDSKILQILVTIQVEKKRVMISFQDNGPGYPDEITREGYQTEGTGLTLVKGIITHNLGGKVHFSNKEGAVTKVSFEKQSD